MKAIEFRIFIPEKKFLWTANRVIFSIIALCFAIAIVFLEIEDHHPIGNLAIEIAMVVVIIGSVTGFINFRRKKHLKGRMDGILRLEQDRIVAGPDEFHLNDLMKIDFHTGDHIGIFDHHEYLYYNPRISNGISNCCFLKLKNGKKKRIQFQQTEKDQLIKNRDLLISYHLKGKMSFYRLFRILGISKTKDVNAFKESLKSYSE